MIVSFLSKKGAAYTAPFVFHKNILVIEIRSMSSSRSPRFFVYLLNNRTSYTFQPNKFSNSVNFSSNTLHASKIGLLLVISTPAFFNTSIG